MRPSGLVPVMFKKTIWSIVTEISFRDFTIVFLVPGIVSCVQTSNRHISKILNSHKWVSTGSWILWHFCEIDTNRFLGWIIHRHLWWIFVKRFDSRSLTLHIDRLGCWIFARRLGCWVVVQWHMQYLTCLSTQLK